MVAQTFSDVKIEKLLDFPSETLHNRFYLIETGGTVRFYLSDSKGNLHLLNEGYSKDINITKTTDYNVLVEEDKAVFSNTGASGDVTFYLPILQEELEFSFHVRANTVRVSAVGAEPLYVGDELVASNQVIESAYVGSFICFRAIEGNWVARYLTGQWDVVTIDYIDGNSASSELAQIIDGGNSLAEYTSIIDGGSA